MRNYLLGAGIAVACSALDVEENLWEKVYRGNQEENHPKGADSFSWSGDFTQENCQDTAPFYVDKLPGFSSTDTWPCSYAGTLPGDVTGETSGASNLFFWIYPAEDADAPVTIWLNGGPGASSAFANFLFNSPLRILEKADGSFTVYTSTETWTKKTTMIYID